ncbi:MAG: hypothetical protein JHC26_09420 [Thermofilum sp.]|jgi:DNA-binding TFAR19-related protein (PDSD5 family)|uniref:hypothetical protein n=1 Tax=Thermofilum sp. TaxID=1961369 RepID=UPI002584A74D|nr:hypothetical protein [Thermofilum sp.]MCI4409300.1 hypothetical protein [Thermofilum sp.]
MNKDELIREIIDQFEFENESDVKVVRDILNRMSEGHLLALYHFMFSGEVKDEKIKRIIDYLKEKSKENFRVEKKGDEVVIDIL